MNTLSTHKYNFLLYPRDVYNSAYHPHKTLEVGGNYHNAQAVLMHLNREEPRRRLELVLASLLFFCPFLPLKYV